MNKKPTPAENVQEPEQKRTDWASFYHNSRAVDKDGTRSDGDARYAPQRSGGCYATPIDRRTTAERQKDLFKPYGGTPIQSTPEAEEGS